MIKVVIDSLRQSLFDMEVRVVLLKEEKSGRIIPIGATACDFYPLMVKLCGETLARPITYDFFAAFVRKTHLSVRSVYIHTRVNNTFQAQVRGVRPGLGIMRNFAVNCRGIDALLTAVHFEVPIYVSEALLAEASMTWDEFMSVKMARVSYGSPSSASREGDSPCP